MKASSPRLHSAGLWLLALAPASVVLAVTASWYRTFFADDAFISLRYSRRLLQGRGLTWDDHHPVEGYSNLLWTLAVAALGACGVELVLAARILGVCCTIAVFAALAWAFRPERHGPVPAGLAAFVLAIAGPFSVWSVGGLEQPMVAACLGWSIALALPLFDGTATPRTPWAAGLALALLVLSRPDSPLFVAGIAGGVVLAHGFARAGWSRAAWMLVLPVAAFLGQTAFRWAYYGELVPNTAVIKAAPLVYAREGRVYVRGGLAAFAPVLGLAFPGMLGVFLGARKGFLFSLLATVAVFLLYLASVGGDIFPAWRHFVPVLVLLAFVLAEGVRGLVPAPRPLQGLLALVAFWLGYLVLQSHVTGPRYLKAFRERWEWDHKLAGELLNQAFADEQPLYAMSAAGALAYYADLPSIDMLGLNDHHIARTPHIRGEPLAHDHADGGYVLDRKTDLIQSQLNGKGLAFAAGEQILADPRFASDYTAVRLQTPKNRGWLTVPLHVRTEGRVGVVRDGDSVRIPGWMFSDTFGRMSGDELLAYVPAKARPRFVVALEPGRYRASVEPAAPGGEASVRLRGDAGGACVTEALTLELEPAPPSFAAVRVERIGDCIAAPG